MTHLTKCDGCGKVQTSPLGATGIPVNPIDDKSGNKWYSRTDGDKEIHACSRACIKDGGLVWPL